MGGGVGAWAGLGLLVSQAPRGTPWVGLPGWPGPDSTASLAQREAAKLAPGEVGERSCRGRFLGEAAPYHPPRSPPPQRQPKLPWPGGHTALRGKKLSQAVTARKGPAALPPPTCTGQPPGPPSSPAALQFA